MDPMPRRRRLEEGFTLIEIMVVILILGLLATIVVQRLGGATDKAKRIWCSADRSKAWDDYMQKGVTPSAAPTCDNPVDKLVQFGSQRGINATPTLVFGNGERVPGAISAAQIEKLLSQSKTN